MFPWKVLGNSECIPLVFIKSPLRNWVFWPNVSIKGHKSGTKSQISHSKLIMWLVQRAKRPSSLKKKSYFCILIVPFNLYNLLNCDFLVIDKKKTVCIRKWIIVRPYHNKNTFFFQGTQVGQPTLRYHIK